MLCSIQLYAVLLQVITIQDFVSETEEKLNCSSLPFLHDHHLLNVPNYFLHESLGWTYHSSEVETGPQLFLICGIFFFYLDSNSSTPHKVQGFVIPLGFPTHYSAGHICCCLVTKLYLTLSSLLDCSPPGSSVHGISQTRILEWVATPYFRGSSQIRDQSHVSCFNRWSFLPLRHQGSPVEHTQVLNKYLITISYWVSITVLDSLCAKVRSHRGGLHFTHEKAKGIEKQSSKVYAQ